MLSSISSSHYHKKYNNLNLNYIDKFGKLQCLFGTEGDSINYEDNMILNYRDINTWNILIKDITELCDKYNISGIHLNNAQSWPQIYAVDLKEIGITNVFNPEKADLSNLTSSKGNFIDKAVHKANIEFSNDGIKAAAATAAGNLDLDDDE